MSPSSQDLFHFNNCVGRVPDPLLLCCDTYDLQKKISRKKTNHLRTSLTVSSPQWIPTIFWQLDMTDWLCDKMQYTCVYTITSGWDRHLFLNLMPDLLLYTFSLQSSSDYVWWYKREEPVQQFNRIKKLNYIDMILMLVTNACKVKLKWNSVLQQIETCYVNWENNFHQVVFKPSPAATQKTLLLS